MISVSLLLASFSLFSHNYSLFALSFYVPLFSRFIFYTFKLIHTHMHLHTHTQAYLAHTLLKTVSTILIA